jgi:uncharacterized protein
MTSQQVIGLVVIGVGIGMLSGMLGIGGGVLVIPLLVFFYRFTQQQAVGTSLAMLLPPIGIFAVISYHRAGYVNVTAAAVLAFFFALGAWAGAVAVKSGHVPERALRVLFALFLLYVGGTMLFRTERRVWGVFTALLVAAGFYLSYFAMRALGRRLERKFSLSETYRRRVESPLAADYEI